MSFAEVTDYISNLTGHITFEYDGSSCGIDPLAVNIFDMWFGDKETTVNSIDNVVNDNFFNGKSLKDIWDNVTELDY